MLEVCADSSVPGFWSLWRRRFSLCFVGLVWFGFALLCFVLFCFVLAFFRAGHAVNGFAQEPCSQEHRFSPPQVGGAHLDFIRKKLLKQKEKAKEALKEMVLLGPTQLINSSMATGR